MDFGVVLVPRGIENLRRRILLAEQHGFSLVGVPDSQCLMPELYTSMGAVAGETESIELGPAVTNPVTRHPAVTAGAMCTLSALTGGRAVLGVGSGDSAVYTLGEQPASLQEMEDFIDLFHRLCSGDVREVGDHPVALEWIRDRNEPQDVPVLLAASGPKTLQLGGRVAERVLIGGGVTPEVLADAVETINRGAREADRDPSEVEKWVFTSSTVTDQPGAVQDVEKSMAAGAGHLTFQFTMEGKHVPEELEPRLRELVEEYDSQHHTGLREEDPNRKLVERLELTDFLLERFFVRGTPSQCVDQLRTMADVPGISGVLLVPMMNPNRYVERMGEEVLPRL